MAAESRPSRSRAARGARGTAEPGYSPRTMAYGVMAWYVDVPKVVALRGSGTARLATWRKNMAAQFERNDRAFEPQIRDGAPTLLQAVEAILTDAAPERGHGFQYAYAFEQATNARRAPKYLPTLAV